MVERPPVGAIIQKSAIEPSDNLRPGQQLTATKNSQLILSHTTVRGKMVVLSH